MGAFECMCGATDCPSCGPAQGYRLGAGIDKTELQHRVETAIDDELSGKTRDHANLIAELTATAVIPMQQRAALYNCETYAEAMLLAVYRGNKGKALMAVEMLEGRVRECLAKEIEDAIRANLED